MTSDELTKKWQDIKREDNDIDYTISDNVVQFGTRMFLNMLFVIYSINPSVKLYDQIEEIFLDYIEIQKLYEWEDLPFL